LVLNEKGLLKSKLLFLPEKDFSSFNPNSAANVF